MTETDDRIKELLRKKGEMNVSEVEDGLLTDYRIALSSDTVWRHLRGMVKRGEIFVQRKKWENPPALYLYKGGKNPWVNYYSLDIPKSDKYTQLTF